MRYLLPSPGKDSLCAPRMSWVRGRRAFTLVELLVAVAVMTLILAMFSQMLGSVSNIWAQVKGGVDNYTAARGILDSLQVDLSRAVIRRDLGAFCDSGGNSQLAFYTERAGLDAPATDRQLQLVSYSVQPIVSGSSNTTMTLQRSALQIAWTDATSLSFGTTNALPQLGNPATDDENAAQGILAMAVNFHNVDGSFSSTFTFGNSQAVTVSLVVLSGRANQLLSASQKTGLETKFTNAAANASSSASVESLWNQVLDDTGSWQGYPQGTAGDIHVFSRTYWLPVQGAN
jgi:prepilin-type N-terminal cleavage/methylation domain-containing protein